VKMVALARDGSSQYQQCRDATANVPRSRTRPRESYSALQPLPIEPDECGDQEMATSRDMHQLGDTGDLVEVGDVGGERDRHSEGIGARNDEYRCWMDGAASDGCYGSERLGT
jgi:hypothetical protein